MLILFTRLSENRPYYKRDLLNICCLAAGERVHFGYKRAHVPETVWSDREKLAGDTVLFVFAEAVSASEAGNAPAAGPGVQATPTASAAPETFVFHPVRLGKVEHARDEHGALAVEISLGEFFDYSDDKQDRDTNIAKFRKELEELKEKPGKNYVCRVDSQRWTLPATKRWSALARHMLRLPPLSNAVFFCVDSPPGDSKSEPDVPCALVPKMTHAAGRNDASLSGGHEYVVTLRLMFGDKATHQPPEVDFSSGLGSVSGPFVRQRSAGAQVDYVLHTKRVLQTEIGMLSIRIPDGAPSSARAVLSPELSVLIRIKANSARLFGLSAAFAAGTFVVSTPVDQLSQLARALGFDSTIGADHWAYWVTRIFGAALVLGASLYGFGRLPLKD